MTPHTRPQQMVLWFLWLSMLNAIVLYPFLLGAGLPRGVDVGGGVHPVLLVALAQLAVATALRWLLIPRAQTTGRVLVLMVLGLALSESAELYGLFLVPADRPETKLWLWGLALAGALQFAPVYARPAPASASPFRAE